MRRKTVIEHLSIATGKAALCTLPTGAQRESWMLALEKQRLGALAHGVGLHRVPYFLARLGEAGVK